MPAQFAKLRNEWLPTSTEELDCSRPWLEIYLNDPFEVPEEDYLTDLYLPLK
jgi:DNA gyrase inhibitor GyrI